ncbi:unnamed protein product [Protopolystoma xenopodis]|uniref:Uncharacterized protein n=1 Tax=Protopolystoma xenopodis TaxID=117903 RepID=A0A448X4B1_9PLAT|nr:unnamed protein product [Protopolystoma xenopodis]
MYPERSVLFPVLPVYSNARRYICPCFECQLPGVRLLTGTEDSSQMFPCTVSLLGDF